MYGSDEFKVPQKRGEVNAAGENKLKVNEEEKIMKYKCVATAVTASEPE
jgi:hypothetical protein